MSAHGIIGDITEKHIKKYIKTGIEQIYIITNLPESHAQKMGKALKKSLENQGIRLKDIRIIPGNINLLLHKPLSNK